MYRATLDTNIFVSGGTVSAGPPYQVVNLWRAKAFTLVVSPQLFEEYEDVFYRKSVMNVTGLSLHETEEYLAEIRNRSFMTKGTLTLNILENDPDDNVVLACAEEGIATHLVTGNKKHFPFNEYKGIQIVTPREFLTLLNQ